MLKEKKLLIVKNLYKELYAYTSPLIKFLDQLGFKKSESDRKIILENINFSIKAGEIVSIVGVNGAGKSTLLKIIANILSPTRGEIIRNGKIVSIIELGTGFDYELSGLENIFLNGLLLGLNIKEIKSKLASIINFSELENDINKPLKYYSTGMIMRLAFSIAIHSNPDLLLIDEALAVGDIKFQQKCYKALQNFKNKGKSILFVSHDIQAVQRFSDKVILLHQGKILDIGTPKEIIKLYTALIRDSLNYEEKTSNNLLRNKALFVKRIALKNINGENSRKFKVGEEVYIEIDLQAKEDIEDLIVGILFKNTIGVDIFGINTDLLNVKLSLKKNQNITIRFIVKLNLAPDTYSLTIAFHNKSGLYYNWLDDVFYINILPSSKHFIGEVYLPVKVTVNP